MHRISFADYNFVPDSAGSPHGTVLVPLESIGYDLAARRALLVETLSGEHVSYEGGGCTYYSDSEAGTQEFVGWSYWGPDSEYGAPIVHLMVLSPDFDESDYR